MTKVRKATMNNFAENQGKSYSSDIKHVNIQEQYIAAKFLAPSCEDVIVTTNDFIAVVDGATDRTGWKSASGHSGGKIAAEVIREGITELPKEVNAHAAVNLLTEKLAEEWEAQKEQGFPILNMPPSAVLVMYSSYWNEVWQIGDVGFRFLTGEDENCSISEGVEDSVIERFSANVRAVFIQDLLASGMSFEAIQQRNERMNDPHWDIIRTQDMFLNRANGEFGFGALNGNHVPDEFIEIFPVAPDVQEIVFASDGYPLIGKTLELTETYLQGAIERDPLCIGELRGSHGVMKGYHSFDDCAYIRFSIHNSE